MSNIIVSARGLDALDLDALVEARSAAGAAWDAAAAAGNWDEVDRVMDTIRELSAEIARRATRPVAVTVDIVPTREADGALTGRAMVRGHFGAGGVAFVAPRRDSYAAALADVADIDAHGLHRWRVSYPSRGFTVIAATGNAAGEIARQRWSDLGEPYAIEHESAVTR